MDNTWNGGENLTFDYKAVGSRIRQARTEQNLTQEQLAELSEISPAFMGHIERGTRKMSLETFAKICSVLSLSTDYVLLEIQHKNKDILQSLTSYIAGKDPDKVKAFLRATRALAENIDTL